MLCLCTTWSGFDLCSGIKICPAKHLICSYIFLHKRKSILPCFLLGVSKSSSWNVHNTVPLTKHRTCWCGPLTHFWHYTCSSDCSCCVSASHMNNMFTCSSLTSRKYEKKTSFCSIILEEQRVKQNNKMSVKVILTRTRVFVSRI